jgi:SAM-dependent methyltransferase
MNELEVKAAVDRYNQRLIEYGPTEKALGWGDKGRSRLRFEVLLSQWAFEGASVIDAGCGFGDLFGHMCKTAYPSAYVGIDINPNLLQVASGRYPNAKFILGNVLQADLTADYVLSSGLFNHKLEDNQTFVAEVFERFNHMSFKGFAANFLSSKVEYEMDNTFHAEPAFVLDLAYRFSNNVVLRNDYMPYEFTVFINKASKIEPNLTVYEEFANF